MSVEINIIRKGFAVIPEEVKHCPVCGKPQEFYQLRDKKYANPVAYQRHMPDKIDFAQKYPTFTCDRCQTIWQYFG